MGFITGVVLETIGVIYELILECVTKLWTNFIEKKNPNNNNQHSKKILAKIIGFLLIAAISMLFIGIFHLIARLFPNLPD